MNANNQERSAVEYTIAVRGPFLLRQTQRTFVRSYVRGFVFRAAINTAIEGAEIEVAVLPRRIWKRISECRTPEGARVLSVYRFEGGCWHKVLGTEVTGLEGCDAAAAYMTYNPMDHVTREYAERITARTLAKRATR